MKAEWTVDDRALWDRMARTAPWRQQWAYGEAVQALGGDVLRAWVRDGRRVLALAQFTTRSFGPFAHFALCAQGPHVLPEGLDRREGVYRALRASVPLRRPRLAILAPDADEAEAGPLSAAGLRQVMTGGARAVIDLGAGETALRAAMDQKWRNRLSAAERAGTLAVRLDDAPTPERIARLAALDGAQARMRGYRNLPAALVQWWGRLGGRRALTLATADAGGREVAAMLFVRAGETALYHIGWREAGEEAANAHPLLLWRAMTAMRGQGMRTLDLGQVDTRASPGLARFKLGAGARPQVLAGCWT
ncbi:MAG: GNAT family N-acetyltransferase [Rubrimonas sp.]